MIEKICERLYEASQGIDVGDFVWCPVPHLEEVPRILEVERAKSEDHFASKFQIVQMNAHHFKPKQKLPIKALSLGESEELLISKAKRRPCIVVACNNTIFNDAATISSIKGKTHLQDHSMILAPLYGTATPNDEKGFPPIMVARIRVVLYNQFFYLPKECPKTKLGLDKESIVRLDRMFPASPNRGVLPMKLRLSQEPLAILLSLIRERYGAATDSNLQMVRELLYDSLPEQCRPSA